MRIKKFDSGYLLRLDFDEELIQALKEFADKEQLEGAFFHGLGGAQSAVLGIYRFDEDKQYHFKDFGGPLEIISLHGNIAMVGDEWMIHAHASISGPDMNVSGGHVKELVIGATCEIYITTRTGKLERRLDDGVGLNLLAFND